MINKIRRALKVEKEANYRKWVGHPDNQIKKKKSPEAAHANQVWSQEVEE